ncbi:hypothetical protein VRRI112168_00295 [Vreelandella rituensis]|uniref:Uncharacterized protein n=1 Tax=Vreelandella rituensis TaxID=2282306 RepID=A0A368UBR9_9GAMM|nr:hypothetical protein [Halomonas rituensis]RCV93862.1 hypothetical protein DU506_01510 [Halomonas rituensis]
MQPPNTTQASTNALKLKEVAREIIRAREQARELSLDKGHSLEGSADKQALRDQLLSMTESEFQHAIRSGDPDVMRDLGTSLSGVGRGLSDIKGYLREGERQAEDAGDKPLLSKVSSATLEDSGNPRLDLLRLAAELYDLDEEETLETERIIREEYERETRQREAMEKANNPKLGGQSPFSNGPSM